MFSLENRKKAGVLITENVPIRMRVLFSNQRIDFSTGYRIDASKWDVEKQKVKNGCTNKLKQSALDINFDLQRYATKIDTIFKVFETQNIVPTIELVRKEFNVTENNPVPEKVIEITFWDVFEKFTVDCGRQNNWTVATFKKFESVKNHLKSFNENLQFQTFTESGLNDYIIFLREMKKLLNSSVIKQLGFLKWFLKWATLKKYNTEKSFESFKPRLKNVPKKVIFLTVDELKQLTAYQIPATKQYLERVRDVFLFSCYSSLRYSDVYNLKRSNIKKDHIEITTIKTSDSLRIDLNDYTRAIISKYKDIAFENDKVLPVISNQKMNIYLKELGQLAGLNERINEPYFVGNERKEKNAFKYELLGTHAGRRTFICYALSRGIPVQVIMKWTGHSDYKAMKPYIDVEDSIKASEMNKFNMI